MKTVLTSIFAAAMTILSSQTIADSKAEEAAIDYRQSTFKMVKWHMGPMAGMVKGNIDYNAAAFSEHANAMASLSHLAPNGFSVKSLADNSRAKAAIWENKADFDKKLVDFKNAATALATAAESNDLATIKPAFGELGKSCKSCHTDYRADK